MSILITIVRCIIILFACPFFVSNMQVFIKNERNIRGLSAKRRKKYVSKHSEIKTSLNIAICSGMAILVSSLFLITNWRDYSNNAGEVTGIGDHSVEYNNKISKIQFSDILINENETTWEHYLNKELMLSKYYEFKKTSSDINEIRKKYFEFFCGADELPAVKIDELKESASSVYGTDAFPETNMTKAQVEKELSKLNDGYFHSNPELYQNDFWIRLNECDENSSFDFLYQTARAADDVLKSIYDDENTTAQQWIFFSSFSISFYIAAIEQYYNNADNNDLSLLYYRMAEIYIYLYKYTSFVEENDDYYCHCLLMAEVFLTKAQYEFRYWNGNEDIHAKLPYFGAYYSEILQKLIFKYNVNSSDAVMLCYNNATYFCNSEFTQEYEKSRKGCDIILLHLYNKFPDLFEDK